MTPDRGDLHRHLRWYPSDWRERYGAELVALIEDELDGRRPSVRFRAAIVRSGLSQRIMSAGVVGSGAPSATRVRAGALMVLVSWAALLVGGAVFAKSAEHYDTAVDGTAHGLAVAAFDAVVVLALLGAVLVAVGAALALPATVRYLRNGGWPTVRRPVVVAAVATGGCALVTVGLVDWAHHLSSHQRNGGSVVYGAAVLGWSVLVAAALAAWTWAGVRLARRLDLDGLTLRIEAVLSVVVAAAVALTSAAIGTWWLAMVRGAPWFLTDTGPGTHSTGITATFVVLGAWLTVVTGLALFGATRVSRSVGVT